MIQNRKQNQKQLCNTYWRSYKKSEVKIMNIIKKIKRILRPGAYTIEELRKHGVKVGENCAIYTRDIDINHGFLITIGNNVTLSSARILAHDGSTKRALGYSRVGRVTIGDNVFVGAGAVICVTIGNNVIIGAGAVIAKDIPEDSVVVGNPAKVIGSATAYIEKNKAMMNDSNVWNSHYSEKSESEKDQMFKVLSETRIGFDV